MAKVGYATDAATLVLGAARRSLVDALPPRWATSMVLRPNGAVSLTITPPSGKSAAFAGLILTGGLTIGQVIVNAQREAEAQGEPPLVVANFAGGSLREQCKAADVGYIDTTGWALLISDSPPMLIDRRGGDRRPNASAGGPVAVQSLNGDGASRVIAALAMVSMPIGVRALAAAASVNPSTVTKTLPTLADAGAIQRSERGGVDSADVKALLDRWTQDYSFRRHQLGHYLAARGPQYVEARLATLVTPSAVTGSVAARRLLPVNLASVLPLGVVSVYSDRPEQLRGELRLREAPPEAANVIIARTKDPTLIAQGAPSVPPLRVVADLMTMGGRAPDEGEQLMDVLGEVPWVVSS